MTTKQLQDAIGSIDDSFIEEAANAVIIHPKTWIPAAAVAACALLTVALMPWGTIFSHNSPTATGPHHTDNAVGILQNDDTSSFEETKGNDHASATDETYDSTQDTTKDSAYNNLPKNTQAPDDTYSQDTENTQTPSVSLPEITDGTETQGAAVNDDDGADKSENNEENGTHEEETTGTDVPVEPVIPDHGVTLPALPTVLSLPKYPSQDKYPSNSSLLSEWRNKKNERISGYASGIGNTDGFVQRTVCEFFLDRANENRIYSPVNAYMTLGMLAETTGGNSRTQLLGLLGRDDVFSLRSSAKNLWNSCYRDDGIVTAVLGNSMWLDNSFIPDTAVTDILAENYYASSFIGNMGDGEYDSLMKAWISEQTKGFLNDTVSDTRLDPESRMSLMSALYYKAEWTEPFEAESTKSRVFHSPSGDVTAQFMYRDFVGLRYVGDNFKATYLELREGGKMWFILPDKDQSVESLFSDTEALGFITGKTQQTLTYDDYSAYMWMFLPKFDISCTVDLKSSLEANGVTDIFDSVRADFSCLTSSDIFVNDIAQAARVSVDENGCEAATVSGAVYPDGSDVDGEQSHVFMLDRPFIFVITSDTGLPLFVGTVNRPN